MGVTNQQKCGRADAVIKGSFDGPLKGAFEGESAIWNGETIPNIISTGPPQPVVLAGNGTVNGGVDEACWQPLPGIENGDSDNAMRQPG